MLERALLDNKATKLEMGGGYHRRAALLCIDTLPHLLIVGDLLHDCRERSHSPIICQYGHPLKRSCRRIAAEEAGPYHSRNDLLP